ncbi:MAG TPA: methionine ABC transporter permease [Acidisoma sp.]|jgi:D-methionine transport system permease protein|uniref:methionine ABC transporter permease n=1 Tax=Acidisoma sp. TaxID=1872115 RepID=UPI002CBEC424|nr:methionine ABC transporter permease [Acidisoma sp.]HTI00849.1 methionine ABC transporter permease [Acidisoma sp.]
MLNLPITGDDLWTALQQTAEMVVISGLIGFLAGLPLALLLVATAPGGIRPQAAINRLLGLLVNGVRSVPFIILLVALIPLTRLLIGTSIGTGAAIVPLAIGATPYFARIAEVSLREVDPGLVEAVRSMGGSRFRIMWEVLIPEALPSLISGFVVTLVTLIGSSAMAGAVGAGGLGDLGIRFGYDEFSTPVIVIVVAILIVLVCGVQALGDRLAARFDHR